MKNQNEQLKIQQMHDDSGKFGQPKIAKLTSNSIIDMLVDEAAKGGVESLENYYRMALAANGFWFNLSGRK
jgi:hypothetical protein